MNVDFGIKLLINAIYTLAKVLTIAYIAFKEIQVAISGAIDSISKFLSKLSGMIGISSAVAAETDDHTKSVAGLRKQQAEALKTLLGLEDARKKELDGLGKTSKAMDQVSKDTKRALEEVGKLQSGLRNYSQFEIALFSFSKSKGEIDKVRGEIEKLIEDANKKKIELKAGKIPPEELQKIIDQIKGLKSQLPMLELSANITGVVGVIESMTKGAAQMLEQAAPVIGAAIGGAFGGPAGAKAGEEIGKAIAEVIKVLSQDPAEFKKMIIDTFAGIPQMLANVIINLVDLPNIMVQAIVALIDKLPILIEAIAQALPSAFATIASPLFWLNVSIAVVGAFIRQVPNMVKAFIDGFGKGVKDLVKGFDPVINAFKGIGDTFNGIKDAFQKIVDGLKSVTSAGGLLGGGSGFGGIGSIVGGSMFGPVGAAIGGKLKWAQGGVPALARGYNYGGIPELRAAQGMIVPGRSNLGDNVPVKVNSREMILNLDQQARLFAMLQGQIEGNRGNSQPIEIHTTVQIEEKELGRSIQRMTLNGWSKA